MAIITISRGSYTRGVEVAEALAKRLGYKLISRDALISASDKFNIPEIKLRTAIDDAPSILDRFTYGKDKYLAYIRTAILENFVQDNVIYHGIAGHAFVQSVSHELSVRIEAEFEDRVKIVMERDNVSAEEARHFLRNIDEERRKWSMYVTGLDVQDSSFYDLIFNASVIGVDKIVENIAQHIQKPVFQTTLESQKEVENLLLAARVKSILVQDFPKAMVSARDGIAYVSIKSTVPREEEIFSELKQRALNIAELNDIQFNIVPLQSEELKTRLLTLIPDIEKYVLDFQVRFDKDSEAWLVTLRKGNRELSTHLEKSDVESCVHGRECYHLGFQLNQFVKSYQAKQDR